MHFGSQPSFSSRCRLNDLYRALKNIQLLRFSRGADNREQLPMSRLALFQEMYAYGASPVPLFGMQFTNHKLQTLSSIRTLPNIRTLTHLSGFQVIESRVFQNIRTSEHESSSEHFRTRSPSLRPGFNLAPVGQPRCHGSFV